MESAWICILPGECLKEKVSQGRRWNAGRTGSRASLFILEICMTWRRRKLVLEEAGGGRGSMRTEVGRSERQ